MNIDIFDALFTLRIKYENTPTQRKESAKYVYIHLRTRIF